MMMRLASLPWYDFREIRESTDDFWHRMAAWLRRHGVEHVPGDLNRRMHYGRQWRSSRFLFGQACGYDVLLGCRDRLQVVATPCYRAPGCEGHCYSSFVVVRDDAAFRRLDDLRGGRCVINTLTSHSGMNILRAMVAPMHDRGQFFSAVSVSGSHEKSLHMILGGTADVAAIDCVTYAQFERHRPELHRSVRVIAETARVPAPPLVTSASTPPELVALVQQGLDEVLADPGFAGTARELMLDGVERLSLSAYRPIADMERLAAEYGYHEIAVAFA